MLSHGERAGFDAWIETTKDKKRLKFHQVEQVSPVDAEDEGSTQAFVECEEGSEFAIKIAPQESLRKKDWRLRVYINGDLIARRVFHKHGYKDTILCDKINEQVGKAVFSRPLRFATIGQTEQDDEGDLPEEFGTISVVIWGGGILSKPQQGLPSVLHLQKSRNEKAIKIGSTVEGGDKTLRTRTTKVFRWLQKPNQNAFYRFTWRYRTRERLIDMGIIANPNPDPVPSHSTKRPRSPTPEPIVDTEPSALLDGEEKPGIAILIAQAKRLKYLEEELKKANEKLKNRLGGGRDDGIIDLSLDDDDDA